MLSSSGRITRRWKLLLIPAGVVVVSDGILWIVVLNLAPDLHWRGPVLGVVMLMLVGLLVASIVVFWTWGFSTGVAPWKASYNNPRAEAAGLFSALAGAALLVGWMASLAVRLVARHWNRPDKSLGKKVSNTVSISVAGLFMIVLMVWSVVYAFGAPVIPPPLIGH